MTVIVLRGEHVLYRLRDKEGHALYVGITISLDRRLSVHRRSAWWPEVSAIDTTVYPDRRSALDAEKATIRDEAPRHNKALNPTWKRPAPNWTRGVCPSCRTERRVDAYGFMSNHNHSTGWCPGTGRRPRAGA